MNIMAWISDHRRSILFLLVVAFLAGAAAAFSLPVALFPDVSFPRIAISLDAGDQPVEATAATVTLPVERVIKSIPGVRSIRSTTSRGSAEISLMFDWGSNMEQSTLQVQAAVAQIQSQLPSGTSFEVRRMNPTVFPVIAYSLTSASVDQSRLRELAEFELAPVLSSIPGVTSVLVQGGAVREFRVEPNLALLAGANLSIDDLTKALTNGNVLKVVGRLEDRHKLLLAAADTRARNVADLGKIIVKASPAGVIRLSDVARISDATQPQTSIVTADGKQAVLLQVYQQPSGNTVQIDNNVKATLANLEKRLAPGVTFRNWYDQSALITGSAVSVAEAILIGIVLAGGVLFLFLRDIKITLIVLIVVPAVLGITVLVLQQAHMSFNIMTLGGMAAAIGLIVDDAIVMIEQIVRHLKVGEDRHATIRNAAADFFKPLAGSSSATIVIFVPLAFLDGVTGAFFRALSLTMASALVVSFVIAWIAIPLLAGYFAKEEKDGLEHGVANYGVRLYQAADRRLERVPLIAPLACAVLIALGAFAYTQVGSGFMPSMDEGGFILDYVAPPGTALKDTDAMLRQVEDILRATPEVETFSRRTGLQLGGGLTEPNTGDFFVRLKPQPRRAAEDIMADVHQRVEEKVPGLRIELAQLMEDLIGDLTSVPQPIEIKIFGDDPAQARALAPKVADLIGKIDGVTEINNGVIPAGDGIDIRIDPVRAGIEGVDPSAVTGQLETYLAGQVATNIQQGTRTIGVRVWTAQNDRATINDIETLPIVAPDGHKVPLSRVADVHMTSGEPELARENLKNMVAVTARIEGRDLGSTVGDVQKSLNASGLFSGSAYYQLGGLYAEQQSAFRGLLVVIAAAFMLVFVLLLFLYERFDFALAIVAMPLLAMAAVFVGLWLTGTELNITAMMGMTMVVGIVTEVAIFYFSEFELLLSQGMEREEARHTAAANRFRPIAMTTLAAILALLPLAFGLGEGSAMQQPLAIAIISGLVVQLPLVLLVMPRLAWLLEERLFRRARL